MLIKILKYIVVVLLFAANNSFASNDTTNLPTDTIALEEIEITANRLVNFTNGAKIQQITPDIKNEYNSSNLSELLSQITPISVKSYGIAGLSNISLRGMHSKHTAILWNGINLQNTMNGGFNMNSVPSFFIDDIGIQHGGSGALFGSGAVGGIIHLNNRLTFDDEVEITYQEGIASFNNLFEGLKVNYSNKNFANSTKAFYKYGKNDFEFINTQQLGSPKIRQENAVSSQHGVLQSNLFKINHNQKISTNIWAQKDYLEIPARITSYSSEQNQETEILRIAAIWNRNGEISSWYSRFYYNYESLVYNDPDINLVSEMDHFSVVGEIENKVSIKQNFLLNFGINNTYEKVMTNNYGIGRNRNRTSLYSSLKYFSSNESFATTLSLREELVDNKLAPFTYSLSTKYYPIKYLNFYGNISRTYNLVSFNDLYWLSGGDENLDSEDGWSWDIGSKLDFDFKNNKISLDLTYFNVHLNNHVIWLPDSTSNWSAMNVEKLWSRGIESAFHYKYNLNQFSTGLDLMYSYTKSTYEESVNTEVTNIGKQIIYIPIHKAYAGVSLSYKEFSIKYYNNYVSERFVSKDNSSSMDPYFISDIALGCNAKLQSSKINIQFKVHNIWNKKYEVMVFYAMPSRYYSISLSYNLNKLNN